MVAFKTKLERKLPLFESVRNNNCGWVSLLTLVKCNDSRWGMWECSWDKIKVTLHYI